MYISINHALCFFIYLSHLLPTYNLLNTIIFIYFYPYRCARQVIFRTYLLKLSSLSLKSLTVQFQHNIFVKFMIYEHNARQFGLDLKVLFN